MSWSAGSWIGCEGDTLPPGGTVTLASAGPEGGAFWSHVPAYTE